MSVTVRMPQLGETVTEGTILRWAKQPGDPIAEDEVLLEVSTDKVDTEVPSPAAGIVLEVLVPAGETVPVGTPLAVIGAAAEMPAPAVAPPPAAASIVPIEEVAPAASQIPLPDYPAAVVPVPVAAEPPPLPAPAWAAEAPLPAPVETPAAVAAPAPAAEEAPMPPEPAAPAAALPVAPPATAPADLGFLSPVVRKLAVENGLDLSTIRGTGRDGRITRQDVQALIDSRARGEAVVEAVPITAPVEVPAVVEAPAPVEMPAVVETAAPVEVSVPAPVAMPVVELLPATPITPAPLAAAEEADEGEHEEAEEEAGEAVEPPKRVGLGRGLGALISAAEMAPILAPPEVPAVAEIPAAPAAPAVAAPVAPAAPAAPAKPAPEEAPPSRIPLRPGDRVEDASRLRLRIAEHMVANRHTAAHVWTAVEADFEVVERVRRRHQEAFKAKEGFSLTYLPFIARATVDALNAFPVVNSSFYLEEKKAVLHGAINLGIAVDLDQRGLIVMNIPAADGMRMRELARRIRGVAEKARSGNLTPDDAAGSTFTITNPGPYGSLMSAPIINVPEVAILSTDTVAKRPVVVTDSTGADAIAVHHVGYLGLTWDHRAFDGATAVLFLRRIKESLETRDWEQELA